MNSSFLYREDQKEHIYCYHYVKKLKPSFPQTNVFVQLLVLYPQNPKLDHTPKTGIHQSQKKNKLRP